MMTPPPFLVIQGMACLDIRYTQHGHKGTLFTPGKCPFMTVVSISTFYAGVHGLVPLLLSGIHHRSAADCARIVDQDIQLAESLTCSLHRLLAIFGLADVTGDEYGLPAALGDGLHCLTAPRFITRSNDHLGFFGSEKYGYGPTNA